MTRPPDSLSVEVTARDIYDELVGLRGDVRVLTEEAKGVQETIVDHEARLRTLEKWKYAIPTALVTTVAGVIVTLSKAGA